VTNAPPPKPSAIRPAQSRLSLLDVVICAALVALGALLRLWGIGFGLPFAHGGDENSHFVGKAVGFFSGGFDPHYFINPPAFSYFLHAVFAVAWGDRTPVVWATDPHAVFIAARVCSVAFGVAAIAFVYLSARILAGRIGGAIAALIVAISPVPVFWSKLALNDVPAMAVGAGSLWLALRYRQSASIRALAGAGALGGLAIATKYTAGIVLLVPVILIVAEWRPERTRSVVRDLMVLAVSAAALCFLANPFALIHPHEFVGDLRNQSELSGQTKLGFPDRDGRLYYLDSLVTGTGLAACVSALLGLLVLTRRDRVLAAALLVPFAGFVLFMGSYTRAFERWLLPVYPIVALAAGVGIAAAAQRVPRRLFRVTVVTLAVLVVADPLVTVVRQDRTLARPGTLVTAHAWALDHIPQGSRVVLDPSLPLEWNLRLDIDRTPIWRDWPTRASPDSFGLTGGARVETYLLNLSPEMLDRYRRLHYCWVIVSESSFGRAFASRSRALDGAKLTLTRLRRVGQLSYSARPYGPPFDDVEPGYHMPSFDPDAQVTFRGSRYQRSGPAVLIYRLDACRS
jgi:hypothetical protein